VLGIIFGMVASKTVSYYTGWPTITPFVWIGAACLSSAGIGIVSGFYPAWKATQLDPIEALRYE
jgi:ABC-type antimicrobial peptide transport system permease subunit